MTDMPRASARGSTRAAERAWRGASGTSKAMRDQDKAAGGRANRVVEHADGRSSLAAVRLTPTANGQVRASLRWWDGQRNCSTNLGSVTASTRASNLEQAWQRVHELGLLKRTEHSWATSPAVRSVMKSNKSRDTKPELLLRSQLHQRGLRYRVSVRPLPDLRRTADIVFPRARVAVFVDGCYWHGCPVHHRPARVNVEFWHEKIETNRARDQETTSVLRAAGWTVVRVWEHVDPAEAADLVCQALEERKKSR